MDETSAPWRVLEAGPASPEAPAPGGRAAALEPRVVATIAAIALAAVLGLAAIWLVLGSGHGSVVVDGEGPRPGASTDELAAVGAGRSESPRLVVDVQGAVVRPGLVELPPGSRVGDAIAAAGGFGPRVASDRVGRALNRAALVHDGDQVIVPSRDDPAGSGGGPSSAPGGASSSTGQPIDLNHATAEELDSLPGVGPATAAKIIAAREETPFASVEDLKTRKVVGSATFEKLKTLVTIR